MPNQFELLIKVIGIVVKPYFLVKSLFAPKGGASDRLQISTIQTDYKIFGS